MGASISLYGEKYGSKLGMFGEKNNMKRNNRAVCIVSVGSRFEFGHDGIIMCQTSGILPTLKCILQYSKSLFILSKMLISSQCFPLTDGKSKWWPFGLDLR